MENISFSIGVLLLMCVWHFVLRKTILDRTRDQLFDLRDEVRETYIRNGWDIGSTGYKRARGLINAHLRFTEEMSLIKIVRVGRAVSKSKELQELVNERSRSMFSDTSENQRIFIQKIRVRSIRAVMEYTVFGSFVLMLIGAFMAPLIVAFKLIKLMQHGAAVFFRSLGSSIWQFGSSFTTLIEGVADLIAGKIIKESVLEDYSFRTGFCT